MEADLLTCATPEHVHSLSPPPSPPSYTHTLLLCPHTLRYPCLDTRPSLLPQSNYKGPACPGTLLSVSAALAPYAAVTMTLGTDIAGTSYAGFDSATAAAAAADAVVLVMGLDLTQEAEALDRTTIAWPGVQAQLIAAVAAAARGPVVLVVLAGGSVDISAELSNPLVGAILWAGCVNGGRQLQAEGCGGVVWG